jgi:dTMP kinase
MQTPKKGLFFTFEGLDGSGKTTQIKLLDDYLRIRGYDVVQTREPGGTAIGEKIREILLDNANVGMGAVCEMLLYAAARAQHVHELIRPALQAGKCVIGDRFTDSSYVYQGIGRGLPLETVIAVNAEATGGLEPDMTFFLDVAPEESLKRRMDDTGADRIESEAIAFHGKVYQGYRDLAQRFAARYRIIEQTGDAAAIHARIIRNLADMLH